MNNNSPEILLINILNNKILNNNSPEIPYICYQYLACVNVCNTCLAPCLSLIGRLS